MKNYRYIVPVAMVLLVLMSWYRLIGIRAEASAEYNQCLKMAREQADKGIVKKAMIYYNQALGLRENADLYIEIIEFLAEQEEQEKLYLTWCEDFFQEYPTDARAYNYLMSIYVQDENYEDCYELLEVAEKRNVNSKYLDEVKEAIKYKYEIEYSSYDSVGIFGNNLCQICSEGYWGYLNRYGVIKVGCRFKKAGVYSGSGWAPVVNQKGEAFFIDMEGDQITQVIEEYEEYGMYIENAIAAKKTDGRYVYVNSDFEPILEGYDYAGTFNYGIAAVKQGENWHLINTKGDQIGEDYADIKLDEKEIAYRNERAFVAVEPGNYIMVDANGNQVGNLAFEDARVFAGDWPTAVKISGQWQFIDKSGNLISENTYADARPFSYGFAAVCIGDKWGYINEKEEIVIEPEFYGAKEFTEKGSCFVDVGGSFRLLKIYSMNR